MNRRCSGHAAAGFRDRAHHDRGFRDAEARTAELFGNADAEPAGLRHRLIELVREAAVAVLRQPIGVVEPAADFQDPVANGVLLSGEGEVHCDQSAC